MNFTELMVLSEKMKTYPFGDVWEKYCQSCGITDDWFEEIMTYEKDVLSKRV